MPNTEGILKSNFFILVVIILLPLEFHSTNFEKLFMESNPCVSLFICSRYSSFQKSFLVSVRVKVYLPKKQEEPFLCFLPNTACARVTVAGVGRDLLELKACFTENC